MGDYTTGINTAGHRDYQPIINTSKIPQNIGNGVSIGFRKGIEIFNQPVREVVLHLRHWSKRATALKEIR